MMDTVRFFTCFFANEKFLLCFLQNTISKCFFYPLNSIVAYPLNGSKPELLAAPENYGWQVPKQLLNFLAPFKPEPLAALLLINKFSETLQAHDTELSLK